MSKFLLRGESLSEIEPDWTERELAEIAEDPEWAADVHMRVGALNELSDENYQRLVDADMVSQLVHPWSGWGDEHQFRAMMGRYLPMPVPVPELGTWDATAIQTDPEEWPLLYVLFPYQRAAMDYRGFIQPATPDNAPQTLDSYSSNWSQLVRYKNAGIEVGYWPAEGLPLLLVSAMRARHPIGIEKFNIPPVAGSVRLRVVNFAVDQSGEKRNGEWSEPIKISHAYSSGEAQAVYADGVFEDYPKDSRFRMWGRLHVWCSSTIGSPYIPMSRAGKLDWAGHKMPSTLVEVETREKAEAAKYSAPSALIDRMVQQAREGSMGHTSMKLWRQALSALKYGEYSHFPEMKAYEAQALADAGDSRWVEIAAEIQKKESAFGEQINPPSVPIAYADQPKYSPPLSVVRTAQQYYNGNRDRADRAYGLPWKRVLIAFGAMKDDGSGPLTAAEARASESRWSGWRPFREILEKMEG